MRTVIFRVLIDTKDKAECYRDIEIKASQSLEDLHFAIVKAFKFSEDEMACFYTCSDEWAREDEFPLVDMGMTEAKVRVMENVPISEVGVAPGDKLILVYDYIKMWTFQLEMISENLNAKGSSFPKTVKEVGTPPKENAKDDFDDILDLDLDLDNELEDQSKKAVKNVEYEDFGDTLDLDDDADDGYVEDYDDADFY